MERQFANIDLALWPCTLEVGLSKVERCSGLMPETQRETVRVSLSFFLGAACGSPYIVFITRFRRMASRNGYIYIYI